MTLRGPVLVGTDFSTASDAALREGRQLADDLKTGLMVCHVLPELMRIRMLFPQWSGIDADFQDTIGTKAASAIDRQLKAVLGDARRDVTVLVDSGAPHAGVLSQADTVRAGIIVTGAGRTADRRPGRARARGRHHHLPCSSDRRRPDCRGHAWPHRSRAIDARQHRPTDHRTCPMLGPRRSPFNLKQQSFISSDRTIERDIHAARAALDAYVFSNARHVLRHSS